MGYTSAYDMVPRALRSLGQTVGQALPARAKAEESLARTKLAISSAEETQAHREKVFETGQEWKEKEWEAGKDVRELAGVTARNKMEEMERQEKWLNTKWNPLDMISRLGGNEEETVRWGSKITENLKHFGVAFNPNTKTFEKDGLAITNRAAWQKGSPAMAAMLAELDPRRQDESRGTKKKPDELIQEYNLKINKLRTIQGYPWVNAETKQYLENKISDAYKEISRLEKRHLEGVKAKKTTGIKIGTLKEVKEGDKLVTYKMTEKGWEKFAKSPKEGTTKKTINMSKRLKDGTVHKVSGVEVGSDTHKDLIKQGLKRGTLTGKPTEEKKPKEARFTNVDSFARFIKGIRTDAEGNKREMTRNLFNVINATAPVGFKYTIKEGVWDIRAVKKIEKKLSKAEPKGKTGIVKRKIVPEKIEMPSTVKTASQAIAWLKKTYNISEEKAKEMIKPYLKKK